VNGSAGARRCARPVRITLARVLGGDIDGAWWPHSASVAGEPPEPIGALHRPLGEIVDVEINWSPTDAVPDLDSMGLRCPVRSTRCRLGRGQHRDRIAAPAPSRSEAARDVPRPLVHLDPGDAARGRRVRQ